MVTAQPGALAGPPAPHAVDLNTLRDRASEPEGDNIVTARSDPGHVAAHAAGRVLEGS